MILFLSIVLSYSFAQNSVNKVTIEFPSEDGLIITADLYQIDTKSPWIILHHQAGFSRGEYLEIAPRLNELGYNCLAADQRSGDEVNGVRNETHKRAVEKGLKTEYKNAITDLEATLKYAKSTLKAKEIIIWGSSYSAALTFYMASQYPDDIKAIVAFSPGEYFEIKDQKISSFAAQVKCPVFISSAKNEKKYWEAIFKMLPGEKTAYLPESDGFHGSRALWKEKEGHEEVWKELIKYLNGLK